MADTDDDELGPAGGPAGPANPFSPAASQGSPQAQASGSAGMTVTPQHMVLMMRQMMDATAAASKAAEAAVAMANSANRKPPGVASSDLARILPKPDTFKPATREEEHGTWIQWFWGFKQYLYALDTSFSEEIGYIEGDPSIEINMPYKSPETEQRSRQLYSLLASLVKGRGLQVIQRIPHQNGFEALRHLIQLFQPSSRTRSLGILSALTTMGHFKNNEPLLPQVLDMERIIDEYERSSGKKLDDDLKRPFS